MASLQLVNNEMVKKIVSNQESSSSALQSEKTRSWLATFFDADMDNMHETMQAKRRQKDTCKTFVESVTNWLKQGSEMIYWTRGIRMCCLLYLADNALG